MVGTMSKLKSKLRLHKDDASASGDASLLLKQNNRRSTPLANTVNVTENVDELIYKHNRATTALDGYSYRTTEQIRGNQTMLTALHEDETASNASSSFTQFSAATPSNYTASTPGTNLANAHRGFSTAYSMGDVPLTHNRDVELKRLQSDLIEVKEDVKAIQREVMNELHVVRYDVLKELALLKGLITQMTAAAQLNGPPVPVESATSDSLTALDRANLTRQTSMKTPTVDRTVLTRQTSMKTSPATRNRIAASRATVHKTPSPAARASVRLTQLAPVADNALSTPLSMKQINDMFPLIDFTSDLAIHARKLTPGLRAWALIRVEEWLDTRFNIGNDTLLAVVGDGGTGKSAFCGTVAQQFRENLVAAHCCQFDRKSKSSPRNVLLSVVHQLVENLPSFKNQLARLNLKYVLEETDPILLAAKILVDPLSGVEEPVHAAFILMDGIDQCAVGPNGRNELLEFFAQVIPQLPSWLGIMVSSKPSLELAKHLSVSSILDFSSNNEAFVTDASSLVDDIANNFSDEDIPEAKKVLKEKSGGNFAYLSFTKQALSHPEMVAASQEGTVDLGILHDLPETLYEIYAEIFEDKFGQGRARVWGKAKPLLQLVVGATAGPYSPVTEDQAMEHLSYTDDDLSMLRRSLVDLVAVKHGAYRIESSALCTWLCDPARSEEHFYFDIDEALQALRAMRRHLVKSDSSSDDSMSSGRTLTPTMTRQPSSAYHETRANAEQMPVGILKRTTA